MIEEQWVAFRVIGGDNHTPKCDQLDNEEGNPLWKQVLQLLRREQGERNSYL